MNDQKEKIPYVHRHEIIPEKIRKLYSFVFEKKVLLSGFRGSIAHGLTIAPEDDVLYGIDDEDTFALYCYPTEYYLSLESYYHRGEVKDHKEGSQDELEYEIRKAMHLLSGCNPNVMTFLYNKPEHYFQISKGGQMLIDNRDLFLSKRAIYMAYSGYAFGQLKKLTVGAFKGYMGSRRKEIVEKLGYDTKNAMTLVRLLRNGQQLLTEGTLTVFREEDRDFLLNIKKGNLTMDEIQKLADAEFDKNEAAYKASKLPDENNKFRINELLVDILRTENTL